MTIISFIIVCRNDRQNLCTTLKNLDSYSQSNLVTREHIEFIVQDGESTDGSWELVNKYSFIKSYRQKDKGIYDAMNLAVKQAKGKYLFFLNAGDKIMLAEEWLRQFVYNFLARKYTDLIACATEHLNQDGSSWIMYPRKQLELLRYGNIFSHQGVFIRKQIFDALDGYDTKAYIVSDWHFLNRAILKGASIEFIETAFCQTAPFGISADVPMRTSERYHLCLNLFKDKDYYQDLIKIYQLFINMSFSEFPAIKLADLIIRMRDEFNISVDESCTLINNFAKSRAKFSTTPLKISWNFDIHDLLSYSRDSSNDKAVEKSLIFLISMPRSGSTLLQRILEMDSRVISAGEPWICIPPLSMKKPKVTTNKCSMSLILEAEKSLLKELNINQNVPQECAKQYLIAFYRTILKGKKYDTLFLDKTPRYIHILPELMQTLPNAKYIVLERNPIDIILSYASTWGDHDFNQIRTSPGFMFDFEHGLDSLVKLIQKNPNNVLIVSFDDLSQSKRSTLENINSFLGSDLKDFTISSLESQKSRSLGDPKTVNYNKKPIPKKATKLSKATLKPFKRLGSLKSILGVITPRVFDHFSLNKNDLLEIIDMEIKERENLISRYTEVKDTAKMTAEINSEKVSYWPRKSDFTNNCEFGLVIACYNNQAEIISCLKSVINSSYVPDKIIISDDASTDDSIKILKEFIIEHSLDNVYILSNAVNVGVSANRHNAIKALNSKYFWTLDGDDTVSLSKFKFEINALRRYNADVAFSDIKVISDKTIIQDTRAYHLKENKQVLSMLTSRSSPVPRDMLISTSLYEKIGGFIPDLNIYEDWNLKQRLAFHSKNKGWAHSGIVGTNYNRKNPGLSKRTPLQHCATQLVSLSLNLDILSALEPSSQYILDTALMKLKSYDSRDDLSFIWRLINDKTIVYSERLNYISKISDNWKALSNIKEDLLLIKTLKTIFCGQNK